jgi:Spy/CpxP family protein refolding chaperone
METKMKSVTILLTALFVCTLSAFAEMGTGQGGGMMGGGWGGGWGMNSGWFFGIIIAILVIIGIVFMMKRK